MKTTKDFAEVIRRKLASNPELAAEVEKERVKILRDQLARAEVAAEINNAD